MDGILFYAFVTDGISAESGVIFRESGAFPPFPFDAERGR